LGVDSATGAEDGIQRPVGVVSSEKEIRSATAVVAVARDDNFAIRLNDRRLGRRRDRSDEVGQDCSAHAERRVQLTSREQGSVLQKL
jgi:hypothetical protein